jgi:hypothetical protein
MVKRVATAVLVVLAIGATAVHLPAQICTMAMPVRAIACDCCATMKSCVRPQKDRTPPATATALATQSMVLVAPVKDAPLIWPQQPASGPVALRAGKTERYLPARLALLCTFLI